MDAYFFMNCAVYITVAEMTLEGFEPSTFRLEGESSVQAELQGQVIF